MLRTSTAIAFGVLFVCLPTPGSCWITEIAVTDRRIIYKRGFINRHTEEMNMDKVASVDVDQSILGRILDYGTVHVAKGPAGQAVERAEASDRRSVEARHKTSALNRGAARARNAITAK
jgi:uncharacterized membrane protein YdbT with pleckstrin-like domain